MDPVSKTLKDLNSIGNGRPVDQTATPDGGVVTTFRRNPRQHQFFYGHNAEADALAEMGFWGAIHAPQSVIVTEITAIPVVLRDLAARIPEPNPGHGVASAFFITDFEGGIKIGVAHAVVPIRDLSKQLPIGTTVRLKSGGPLMTVADGMRADQTHKVVWFGSDGVLRTDRILVDALDALDLSSAR